MHLCPRPILVLACFGALAVGCGPNAKPDGPTDTSSTSASRAPGDVSTSTAPDGPWDEVRVSATFGRELEQLGLRVTRAGRSAGGGGGYGTRGSHLAIYVAPTATSTPDQYVERIVPLARVFLPAVFQRIPDIDSFDVCQEPFDIGGGTTTPPPLTQVLVERRHSRTIPWTTLRLEDLVAASRATPNRAVLVVRGEAANSPSWAAASAS